MTRTVEVIAITLWALAIGVGFAFVTDYSTRPGQSAQVLPHLPVATLHEAQKKRPTLLLFAHPHCPCTRATLAELARLLAHHRGQANVQVLFYHPLTQPREWVEAKLWQQAKQLPDVVVSTVGELDLLRFGVSTSGQTLLYDAAGTLVFSGGITNGRGHEGDNTGRSAISTYLQTGEIPLAQTPVFGCALTAAES